MKHLILTALLALPFAAQAQDTSIEDVITQQLQAFNDRDVDAAWEHASPFIKDLFRTPENFALMVQNGYPMVWDNSDIRFLDQQQFNSRTRQEVLIQGADGLFYILDYQMIATPEGWLITPARPTVTVLSDLIYAERLPL